MNAQIITRNLKTATDASGTKRTTADVFVQIIDDDGQLTPGNNVVVTIKQANGNGTVQLLYITVPGTEASVYSGMTRIEVDNEVIDYVLFLPLRLETPDEPVPVYGDVTIYSVTTDQKESHAGAHDARVTINAFASYAPVLYSLDNITFQPSPVFTGLTGGAYTAYAKDATNTTVSFNFTILTVKSLLVSDPSVDLGGGNLSRWSAAFNPVVFTYQRRDFEVTDISPYGYTGTLISVNGYISQVQAGEYVYVNAGNYAGTYKVTASFYNGIAIEVPYVSSSDTTGFLNSNTMRGYYNITTRITYQDKNTGQTQTITSVNRPDSTGLVRADLSSFLQSLLYAKDDGNYTKINYRDANLSASYQIAYQENWVDASKSNQSSAFVEVADPYYVTYTARQLGAKYGGNMAAYVPFRSVINPDQRAKWITDFAEPAYSIGYPFDIGFIYSEDLIGLNLYYELIMLDANRQPLSNGTLTSYLLNDDNTFLLNEDGSRFIIKQSQTNLSGVLTPGQLGLNRLLIDSDYIFGEARYFTIALKYNDVDTLPHQVTQTQTIRVDDAVDDNSVYLRWLGLSGSWNYYRFVFNQEVSLDVQNAVIIKNFVTDWESQEGIEEVISKNAGQKVKVMAEDLSVSDIKGLQSVKYSPKVQMLISKNPVKWQTVIINTATYTEYETHYGRYQFSLTFNMPSINIQTQ